MGTSSTGRHTDLCPPLRGGVPGFPLILSIILLMLAGIQWYVYSPALPATIALHFNAAGLPDNFGPKGALFIIEFGVMLFITLVFPFSAWFIRNPGLKPISDAW